MMMPSAFIAKTGTQSPPKARSSAPYVTNGLTIHAPVLTAMMAQPSTSVMYAQFKHFRYFRLQCIPVFH
jgi:hypothetical protein